MSHSLSLCLIFLIFKTENSPPAYLTGLSEAELAIMNRYKISGELAEHSIIISFPLS